MRLKKISVWLLSSVTRWLWRLAVLMVIAVAVTVSAGRQLAPLLHAHKTWLETNLTTSIGQIVTMQSVDAYWEGLVPELVVKQLAIGNLLQVDNALMRVDLLGSLKARTLVFDTLDISRASVKIPVGLPDEDQALNIRAYLEFLFGSADIRVRDLDMTLIEDSAKQSADNQLYLHMDELTVQNDQQSHWLNSAITIGTESTAEKKAPVQLVMKFVGDASDIFSGKGRAHFDFGDRKNLSLLQRFLYRLPNNQVFAYITKIESGSGEIWASWSDQRIEWVSETDIKGLAFAGDKYTVDFSGKLAGHILMEDRVARQYFMQVLPDQTISVNQRPYPLPVLGLQFDNRSSGDASLFGADDKQSHITFYVPGLNLATMTPYLDLLPSQLWRDVLKTLKPSGELKNITVSIPVLKIIDNQGWLVRANLDKVSVATWKGAPALTSVDGYVEASADSGFVEIDSQQGFSMHYNTLYHQPMKYDQALGRVHWSIESATQHVYVGSHDIDLHGEEGELRGSFWLDIPPTKSPQAPELYLLASLDNTSVKFRNKYLPYTLDPTLKSWLDSSIQDGTLTESGFIYRGALQKNEPQEQALVFFSNIKNAHLKFDPEWPVLGDMDGFLLVDNETVQAKIKKGNFLGFNFSNAIAEANPSANQQAHFLTLQADVSGPGNDILNVMRDTPLKQTFGNTFDGWSLSGNTKGHINLGVRIGEAEEPNSQEIDLHLDGNDLWIGGVDLPLAQLKGDAHYSSVTGLTAPLLDAHLWNEEETITITPEVHGEGMPDIAVRMKGTIDPQAAALWAHLPFVHFFQGDIPVEATLNVPLHNTTEPLPAATIVLNSDMKGVAVNLPAPFKKSADEVLPATVKVDLWKDKQQYHVEYGSLISGSVEQSTHGKLKGDIVINPQGDALTELPDYFRVRATLDQATLADWLPVIERNTAFTKADEETYKKNNPGEHAPVDAPVYPIFDLFINHLMIGSMKLDDMKLAVDYQKDSSNGNSLNGNYWNVAFQNAIMTGRYHAFDDVQQLPEVEFDTVKIGEADSKPEADQPPAVEDDSKRIDPLADIIPQDLPAMRVHVKQVILKGDDVGDWRYVLKPTKQGAVLQDMYIAMPGLTMRGLENDHGATLRWYRDGNDMHTEVSSRFDLSNQDGAKKLFGVEKIIEAQNTEIHGSFQWKGSPAMLSFRRLQGDLALSSEKGRFLNSTASTDLMRVINVFNFSTWARRLKLDFTDLYKKGVSFDKVSADIALDRGKVTFDKPLIMEGPSGRFELKGMIDSVQNTVDASLIVTIPVNQNATWIAALAAGLPVAAGVWAVSKIFGHEIDKLSSISYTVSGSLDDPKVQFVSLLPDLQKEKPKPDEKNPAETKNTENILPAATP